MPSFTAKYTADQREAVGQAHLDRGIRPARRIVELAAAGELVYMGERLEPFTMPENTVRDIARKMRRRRAGEIDSKMAQLPARDAVEMMRRRLVRLFDNEMRVVERMRPGSVKAEQVRQLARVAREIAALPGPDDPRPSAPGQQDASTGTHNGVRTTGGMAGAILQAARVSTQEGAAPHTPTQTQAEGSGDVDVPRFNADEGSADRGNGAGSWVGEQLESGGAQLVGAGRS